MSKHYQVHSAGPTPLTTAWEGAAWNSIPTLRLDEFMGDRPRHFPQVEARVSHDRTTEHLDIIYRVQDRYVTATATAHQQMVCQDSCVEFFWTPAEDVSLGYFNLEINCGGKMLLHYQRIPRVDAHPVEPKDLDTIQVLTTLPERVVPERTEPTTWIVACRLPLSILQRYFPIPIAAPQNGTRWRANFFKCADHSSQPHWLTWAPVDHPTPDFHRPADFGTLVF